MAVEYYKPDKKKAEEIASNPTSKGGRDNDFKWFYTHKYGEYRLRILPPWDEKGLIGLIVGKHYGLPGTEGGSTEKHTCIEKTHPDMGADCPICSVLRKWKAKGVDVGKYEVRNKSYMNAILLEAPSDFWESDDHLNKGDVVIFNHPTSTYDWVWRQIADEDVGDITNPEEGYDIKITRVRKNGNTRYERKLVPKSKPIAESPEKIQEILEQMYDLSSIWTQPDDEIFEKIKASSNRLDEMLGRRLERTQGENESKPGEEVDQLTKGSKKPTPPAPSKPEKKSSPEDDVRVWYSVGGEDPQEGTIADVKKALSDGEDADDIMVMPYDQSEDWVTAEEWGINS